MKTFLKWLFGVMLLVVVLALVFLLSLDTILRRVVENRIYAQTGMTAEIGKFHFGLSEPVVTIKDFKLYNSPEFGSAPLLEIPEIHVEYDSVALQNKQIHLTLVRLNLSELDIVKNEAGQTNLLSFGVKMPRQGQGGGSPATAMKEFKQNTGFEFKGIDTLNVSVGTVKFIDLKDPKNNREQHIGIENCVLTKTKDKPYGVQTLDDLTGLGVLIALRGGDFFTSVFGTGMELK
jgi:uncharacterized protein involved in outer membrane biogenesis